MARRVSDTDIDLSVFRKQREAKEKKASPGRKTSEESLMKEMMTLEEQVDDLQKKVGDTASLKAQLNRYMRENRRMLYINLVLTVALFAFVLGAVARYFS